MTLQLYDEGSSGYGSAATGMLTGTLPTTDSNGSFNFANPTCAHPNDQIYLVGTGGDPIAGNTGGKDNTNLALIATAASAELGSRSSEEIVLHTLAELREKELVQPDTNEPLPEGITRRQMISKAGLTAAALLPVIAALTAPPAAAVGGSVGNGDGDSASGGCAMAGSPRSGRSLRCGFRKHKLAVLPVYGQLVCNYFPGHGELRPIAIALPGSIQ
jgi:hypothetical protein